MKILVVGIKKNPQLARLKEEGEKLGCEVRGCLTSDLTVFADKKSFRPILKGDDITRYDLLYLMVSKRRWQWYAASYYLAETNGTTIVNEKVVDPSYKLYLTPAMNYLKQQREGLAFPKSAILYSEKSLDSVLGEFEFPLIVKIAKGRQGRGVSLVNDKDELVRVVKKGLETSVSVVIREYIPNDGDVRVFTVGYKVIGAMKRTPPEGDFRSNISVGGEGSEFDIDSYPDIKDMAEKASFITRTQVAGVDIMINKENSKPYILEVNPAPQFMGLEKYTDTNAAGEIIKYFQKLHEDKKSQDK
ncbi:MAG: RimK family alpha-L-glutamate ligase [Candidatus Woesebacteria bacterium]|jgi:RimK family alpha-L-glutamate ligase